MVLVHLPTKAELRHNPLVYVCVRPCPCFECKSCVSGCAFYRFYFFLPTNTCIITWRLFVYAILFCFFSPLSALAGMQMFSIYDCICVRSRAEWLQQSQVLPRELVRAAAVLFVFHCCSNNGSPRAGSPPNWETTERARVRRGKVIGLPLHQLDCTHINTHIYNFFNLAPSTRAS